MQRNTRTVCLAFTLETLALKLSLAESPQNNQIFQPRRGYYLPPKESANCLVMGLFPNGTRRTMQEVADELAIKVGAAKSLLLRTQLKIRSALEQNASPSPKRLIDLARELVLDAG
jgi:hypothetical protein